MHQLRHYLDVTANGANQDWQVQFASSAWEAVERGSADTDFIQAQTVGHRSDFVCGDGLTPPLGFISAVTVHYRVRSTDTPTGAAMIVDLLRAGAPLTLGHTIIPVGGANWIYGEYRIDVDPATAVRFLASGMADLGVMVEVTAPPVAGYLQATELWLEIEWMRWPLFYDPVTFAALPDAIVGDMAWATTGTQPAVIVGTQLRLADGSAVDWKAYQRTIPEYGTDYTTEVTTRFTLTTTMAGPAFVYQAASVDDGTYAVDLCCLMDASGTAQIGLITRTLDYDDPAAYFAVATLDWTQDHHYRLVIDRDPDMSTSNHIRVYVDYSETPTLEAFYSDFIGTSGAGSLEFGTGFAAEPAAQCNALISYLDWWSYDKHGDWRHWNTLGVGNNTVDVNTTDSYIAKPVQIVPPGIWTGQSERCCVLQVQDLLDECSVWTYFPTPDPLQTYAITVDYRVDTLATTAKLQVQRTSDHWYWNNGASVWQAAASDVTLVYNPTRTRVTAMTALTNTADDRFIIMLRNDVAVGAAHNVYLYKVDMRYE